MNEKTRPEKLKEPHLLDLGNLPEIAQWLAQFIALSAASGVIGSMAYDMLKNLKRRFGRGRVNELEEKVYEALKKVQRDPRVSDEDLRNRAAALFREYENH